MKVWVNFRRHGAGFDRGGEGVVLDYVFEDVVNCLSTLKKIWRKFTPSRSICRKCGLELGCDELYAGDDNVNVRCDACLLDSARGYGRLRGRVMGMLIGRNLRR